MRILFFIIYQLLQLIFFPLIAIFLIIHHFKRKTLGQLPARLGFITTADHNHPTIWLHAVSVGEVLSIQELINLIKKTYPHARCYVTVGTPAGKRIAKIQLSADYFGYLPYDLLPCMLMAYQRILPVALFIIEAELWPNLIMLARFKKIPLFLLNARIKQASLTQLPFIKIPFKILYNCFETIFAQSPQDTTRFKDLGINPTKIVTMGNLKAFNVIAKKTNAFNQLHHLPLKNMRVLLVGSIHPGEDAIYLNLFKRLKPAFPTLKLILAPRHFTWQALERSIQQDAQFSFFTWTDTTQHSSLQNILSSYDIVLLCKLGELFNLYPSADLFFLGGTFVPVGGHNLLEPAAWGTPSIVGPYHQNCNDIISKLTPLNGIVTVKNQEELYMRTQQLLLDNDLRSTIGANSLKWVTQEAEHVKTALNGIMKQLITKK